MGQKVADMEIGFVIDTGGAFDEITRLENLIDPFTRAALEEFRRIEQATKGMVNVDPAVAELTKFSGMTARELAKIESAGERMAAKFERDISVFGKTTAEIREMKAAVAALNAEQANMPELAGRIRAGSMALREMEGAGAGVSKMSGRARNDLAMLSFQANDVATMFAMGADPMRVFASQAGQVAQLAQTAEGGVKGLATNVGALGLRFAPVLIGMAAMALDLHRIQGELENDAPAKSFIAGLGLTDEQVKKLTDTTVTGGDLMKGVWKTVSDAIDVSAPVKKAQSAIDGYLSSTDRNVLKSAAGWYGAIVGSYRAIVETWKQFPAVMGDLMIQGANRAIMASEWLANKTIDAVNKLGAGLDHVTLGRLDNPNAGAATAAWAAIQAAISATTKEGERFLATTIKTIGANTIAERDARMREQADKLKEDDKHKAAKKADADAKKLAEFQAFADERRLQRAGEYHAEVEKIMAEWGKPVDLDKSIKRDMDAIGEWMKHHGPTAEMEQQAEQIRSLADMYEGLFSQGTGNIWDNFEREGLRIVADLAARFTQGLREGTSILDAAKASIEDFNKQSALSRMSQGAGIGTMSGSMLEMTGVRGSATGAALGGTIGAMTSLGPYGALIGGALGSFAGGLLKTTKKGVATLGMVDGQLDILNVAGNSAGRKAAAMAAGNDLIDTLTKIADQLNGYVAGGSVSVGIRKDAYRVDPTGMGRTKGAGVMDFGDDQEAALRFALTDLIADGAIKGITEAQSRLINGGDLEKQLQKALSFQGVFDELEKLKDPQAFELKGLDRELDRLKGIFAEAGASTQEYASLEELFQLKRREITEGAVAEASNAAEIAAARRQMEIQIMDLTGDHLGAIAAARQIELEALDVSLRPLQLRINSLQDEASAREAATVAAQEATRVTQEAAAAAAAIAQQRLGLEGQILTLLGDTTEIRRREWEALDATLRPLKERIWAIEDERAATDAAARASQEAAAIIEQTRAAADQAAQEALARQQAIASQREGLELQLLEIDGNTAELRRRELADMDPMLRALQQLIWARRDEVDATAAAAQAEQEAAAKRAAIAQQRDGLERQLLELQGNTAALRRRELAGLDPLLRGLQRQVYAVRDAQEAARAAEQLRDAWRSVGGSIMDEVRRIRGLTDTAPAGFAAMQGQFNAAIGAARAGDQDAAKSLPGLSKALLDAAALVATSRQELDRVQGITAASLQATYDLIERATASDARAWPLPASGSTSSDTPGWWATFAASQGGGTGRAASNDELVAEIRSLKEEVKKLRDDQRNGHAAIAGHVQDGSITLRRALYAGGGNALAVVLEDDKPVSVKVQGTVTTKDAA